MHVCMAYVCMYGGNLTYQMLCVCVQCGTCMCVCVCVCLCVCVCVVRMRTCLQACMQSICASTCFRSRHALFATSRIRTCTHRVDAHRHKTHKLRRRLRLRLGLLTYIQAVSFTIVNIISTIYAILTLLVRTSVCLSLPVPVCVCIYMILTLLVHTSFCLSLCVPVCVCMLWFLLYWYAPLSVCVCAYACVYVCLRVVFVLCVYVYVYVYICIYN